MNIPFAPWSLSPRVARSLFVMALAVMTGFASGCVSAKKTVGHRDIAIIQTGMARADILKEFGRPVSSTQNKAGMPVDIFTFVQESKPRARAPQPIDPSEEDAQMVKILLGQAGVSPVSLLDGKTVTVQVNYDDRDVVEHALLLDMAK